MAIASFKSRERITDIDAQQAFHILRNSNYVLIGPGSPTYAVDQWKMPKRAHGGDWDRKAEFIEY